MNDVNPDYVVVGETKHYDFHMIERAVFHVKNGAKLIGLGEIFSDMNVAGTNRDLMDRVGNGYVPSTGYLILYFFEKSERWLLRLK
jgi:NagD protein